MADAPRRGALLARLAEQEPELLQAAGKSISARHVGVLVDRRAGGNWWLNWAGVDVVDPRREQAEAGFAASIAQCTPPPMRLTKLRLDCLHLHKSNAPIAQFGLVAQTVRRARRPPIRRPAAPDPQQTRFLSAACVIPCLLGAIVRSRDPCPAQQLKNFPLHRRQLGPRPRPLATHCMFRIHPLRASPSPATAPAD